MGINDAIDKKLKEYWTENYPNRYFSINEGDLSFMLKGVKYYLVDKDEVDKRKQKAALQRDKSTHHDEQKNESAPDANEENNKTSSDAAAYALLTAPFAPVLLLWL